MALPNKATNPTPADGAMNIEPEGGVSLSWSDGGGATSYRVYIGREGGSSVSIGGSHVETSIDLSEEDLTGALGGWPISETFQWRIDSWNDEGSTTGDTWEFVLLPQIEFVKLGRGGLVILCGTERGVFTSFDFGSSWTQTFPDADETSTWYTGNCSGNGTYMIVALYDQATGGLYRTANGGSSWAKIDPTGEEELYYPGGIALSSNGQYVIIVGTNTITSANSCYLSSDYGVTWEAIHPTEAEVSWSSCSISDDGKVMGVAATNYFYASFDYGETWSEEAPPGEGKVWRYLSISGDGKTGVVCDAQGTDEWFKVSGWGTPTLSEGTITSTALSILDDGSPAEVASTIGLGTGDSPTFTGLNLSELTASRLAATDGDKAIASVANLTAWVAGTANEISVSDDGDGTVTIGIVDPLIVGKGGIGVATLTDHGILLGSGTDAITPLGAATDGQLPIGSAGTDPVLATLTEGEGIDVSNGAGAITIAGEDASTTNKGIASFNAANFSVTAGAVSLAAGGGLAHNSLGSLQGGTTDEYYHLTATEHGGLNIANWDTAYSHSQLVSGNPHSVTPTELSLVIGTDVQAWDAQLDDIAALAVTDGNFIVGDGTNWVAESGATARTSLGLGTGDTPQFAKITADSGIVGETVQVGYFRAEASGSTVEVWSKNDAADWTGTARFVAHPGGFACTFEGIGNAHATYLTGARQRGASVVHGSGGGGLSLCAGHANGVVRIYAGGDAAVNQVMKVTPTGLVVTGTATPVIDATHDLGAVGGTDYRWRHLYLSGNLSDETNTVTIANCKTAYDHSQLGSGNPHSVTPTELGLLIGTNTQAWDAGLDDIAALAVTDSNIIVGNGTHWVAESGATARTSLGLGTGDSPRFTVVTAAAGGEENNEQEVYRIARLGYPASYYHSIFSSSGSGLSTSHRLQFRVNDGSPTGQNIGITILGNGNVGFSSVTTPLEDVHAADTVRADVAFNLNGTDGLSQTTANPGSVTSSGGIITAMSANPYGSMYADNISESVAVSATDTAYEITGGFTTGEVNGVTFPDDHYLQVATAGDYLCVWSISADMNTAGGEIEGGLMINGVAQAKGTAHATESAAASATCLSGNTVLALTATQQVSLFIANHTNTNDITVEHANLSIVKIGA